VNEAVMVVMLALVGIAGWAVLGPYQRGTAAVLERAGDPLEDERRRALRSLRDLDEDLALGKLDEEGHKAARAEAEARAVAVLRALEHREGTGELQAGLREVREQTASSAPPSRWRRVAFAGLAVAVVVAGTTVLVTGATSNRSGDQTITGADVAAPQQPDQSAPLSVFEQRVKEHPGDVAARLDLGRRYLDANKLREATDQYLAALKLDPGNVDANTNVALLLFRSGLVDQAVRAVNRALATDARYPEALYAKGLIELMGVQDPKAAVKSLQAYLAAAPFGSHRDTVEQLLQFAKTGTPPPPGAAPAPTP
jgi:cytochrome c-type biogenesis protein CcmH/NrfG